VNLKKSRVRWLQPGELFFTGERDHYDMVTCVYACRYDGEVTLGYLDAGLLVERVYDEDSYVYVVNMEEQEDDAA